MTDEEYKRAEKNRPAAHLLSNAYKLLADGANEKLAIDMMRKAYNVLAVDKELYHYGLDDYNIDMRSGKSMFFKTGYEGIDSKAQMRTGYVTTFPAYKNHGKSVMMSNILLNQLNIYGGKDYHFMYYSFETKERNILRQLSRMAYYDTVERKTGGMMSKEQWDIARLDPLTDQYKHEQAFVEECCKNVHFFSKRLSPEDLKTHIAKCVNSFNVKVVYIDYVQDMQIKDHNFNFSVDIAQTMVKLSELADMYDISIGVAAQFGRVRGAEEKKQLCYLENIFGSSEIEAKSDVIYSIFNRDVFKHQTGQENFTMPTMQTIEVDILKQREQKYARDILLGLNTITGRITQ